MSQYKTATPRPFMGPLVFGAAGEGINVQTISAALTLGSDCATWQVINGGAANRDVTLPAHRPGLVIIIRSSGANSLVVKNAAGDTIGTVTTGASMIFGAADTGAWVRVH